MDNKRKKKYIATDSKSAVNEPAVAYRRNVSENNAIPKEYVTLKEGMSEIREYIKSLYE